MMKQIKVGITGGIGSGKSFVAEIVRKTGYPVYIADNEAKRLMVEDTELTEAIKKQFGESAYLENGALNRAHLASIVFEDKEQLSKLNQLVHPAVYKDFQKWAEHQIKPIVFKEAALLIETGSHRQLDFLIVVTAPEQVRIKRVMDRDGVTENDVRSRMKNQLPQAEKDEKADFLIINDGKQAIVPQLSEALEKLNTRACAL